LEEPITYTVDSGVHTYRSGIRSVQDTRCVLIQSQQTLPALITLVTSPEEIPDPNAADPNNAPLVANPAALPGFPSQPTTVTSYV